VPSLIDRLGVELPVVQAGMGGGCAGHALAAAVSEAGGLGTIGFAAPDALSAELTRARELTGGPIAVNLLLPFARRRHFEAASEADAVVTFWGSPKRRTDRPWLHQCGSVAEALAAHRAGADGVILQGVESGGHVRGELAALDLLDRARRELPAPYPLWLAGGIADADGTAAALDAGAEAAVAGTRFLASEESGAHAEYKRRLLAGRETLLTELFGAGWPAPHRVLPNAATRRWCAGEQRGPGAIRLLNRLTAPLLARAPASMQGALARRQRAGVPMLGPQPPVAGGPAGLLEAGPLYAGETVAAIDEILPAATLVGRLGAVH
jgi:NAD(P)H-dependent flavin oxidoreductase YrpB (nitropropane dioxygenase family)